ncbi:SseB family protein [Clostridium vitabionis]|jgi:hypothetical protein|uniref:SseB family protein n=1 Tax=Clostridium vitabionis TaxID=2784388 RepID=UPI00188CC9D8|nr:SseB family protein [Clostridium vitabionis]
MEKVHQLIAGAQGKDDPKTAAEIIRLLKTEDGMYTVEVRITGNYYLGSENEEPAAYIFTNESYAREFALTVRNTGLTSRVRQIIPKVRHAFFDDLYRSGFRAVSIDRNHETMTLSLFAIISRPKNENGAVLNPGLLLAANTFYQAVAQRSAVKSMQTVLTRELYDAEYLVPCTDEWGTDHPMIGNNDGEKFYPVFTDIVEFSKFDRKHQFSAQELDIEALKKLAKKCDGVVVNPFGFNLSLSRDKVERIISENGTRENAQA